MLILSECGILSRALLPMFTNAKRVVTRRTIRPGTLSGGTRKDMNEMEANRPEFRK